jgi:hypothetical protein
VQLFSVSLIVLGVSCDGHRRKGRYCGAEGETVSERGRMSLFKLCVLAGWRCLECVFREWTSSHRTNLPPALII